jgi:hypothetical protein
LVPRALGGHGQDDPGGPIVRARNPTSYPS